MPDIPSTPEIDNAIQSTNPNQDSQLTTEANSKSIIFVPTTILFCFPIVLLMHQIGTTLKYPDTPSFILLIVGGFLILRSYLVGFLSLNKAYLNHRWFLFILNLALTLVTLWSAYAAISDLTLDTYPDNWFLGITAANLLFLAQVWVNKVYTNQYIQIQLLQIVFSMISIGALWQYLFSGQRWFLTLLSIVIGLFEQL